MNIEKAKIELRNNGYSILASLYSENELLSINSCIDNFNLEHKHQENSKDLYAIRQLLKNIPELQKYVFNKNLITLLNQLFDSTYFLSKAIYFDKPKQSNWFVPFHQDLSISVDKRADIENYTNWTFKKGQHGVQPPLKILEDTITMRIHLDDTNALNGALKVIPKSHNKGVLLKTSKYWQIDNEHICNVNKGGVMLMKPLILHASNKTTNNKQRRVIHLEFNTNLLHPPLNWLEQLNIN